MVGCAQPAVVEIVPGSEDTQHQLVLQVGGHAGQVGRLSLAVRLGCVVIFVLSSSLVTFPRVQGAAPVSLTAAGPVGSWLGLIIVRLLTDKLARTAAQNVVPGLIRPHVDTVLSIPAIVRLTCFPVGEGVVPDCPVRPSERILGVPVVGSQPGVVGVPRQAEHEVVLGLGEDRDQLSALCADTGLAGSLPGDLKTILVETSRAGQHISPGQ